MMNLDDGRIEALFPKEESNSEMMERFAEMLQQPNKQIVLLCNPKDERQATRLLEEKGVRFDVIRHDDGLDGRVVLSFKDKDEELSPDELKKAVEGLQALIQAKEPKPIDIEAYKRMEEYRPTIDQPENRAFLREQHKFALRQSNRFRKK